MKRRRLTPLESDLWKRATRDVAPFGPGGGQTSLNSRDAATGVSGSQRSAGIIKQPPSRPLLPKAAVASLGARDPFLSGDPRFDRHVRRGLMPIDATIDLHGYNQIEARAALYSFLSQARANGGRCILAITGKGGASGSGRGILRTKLRDWLREDAFRRHITRASAAHPRHGGSGAFYIFLKS